MPIVRFSPPIIISIFGMLRRLGGSDQHWKKKGMCYVWNWHAMPCRGLVASRKCSHILPIQVLSPNSHQIESSKRSKLEREEREREYSQCIYLCTVHIPINFVQRSSTQAIQRISQNEKSMTIWFRFFSLSVANPSFLTLVFSKPRNISLSKLKMLIKQNSACSVPRMFRLFFPHHADPPGNISV